MNGAVPDVTKFKSHWKTITPTIPLSEPSLGFSISSTSIRRMLQQVLTDE